MGKTVFNLKKCFIYWPHPSPPPPFLCEEASRRGLEIVRHGGLSLFGSVVGRDQAAMSQILLDKIANLLPALNMITTNLDPQRALLVLRACAPSRLTHCLRAATPGIALAAATLLDDMIVRSICTIMELDLLSELDATARTRLHLPLRHGGAGIQSLAFISSAAFVAGFSLALPRLVLIFPCLLDSAAPLLPLVFRPSIRP